MLGGLALKKVFTRRYNKDEFEKIIPEIREKMLTLFTDAQPTKYYSTKESFGDADFLCLVDKPITVDIKDWIQQTFNPGEIYKNSNVYSFDYKELQVDMITVPTEMWESCNTYFSYNDIHNLIGKLFHSLNLKWGQDGLRYVYRIDGKILGEINLTTDYRKAFPLIGLDPEIYSHGFDTLEEMFEYVVTSPYFTPEKYDLENLNRINRERDKKRKTYNAFIQWIEPLRAKEYKYFYHDKKVYLGLIDHFFPTFLKQYRELEIIEATRREIASYYNGNIIMEYFPDLKGESLGRAMKDFEKKFGSKQLLDKYILETKDTEEIMDLFKEVLYDNTNTQATNDFNLG